MTLLVTCPGCRRMAQTTRNVAGKRVRCTGCGELFTVPPGTGELIIEWGPVGAGQRLPITPGQSVSIGRTRENDVSLPGPFVSRRHAVLEWKGGEWRLRDLGSTNGTLVDGQRISEIGLTNAGRFMIGDFALRLAVATTGPTDIETALEALALDEPNAGALAVVGPADREAVLADSHAETAYAHPSLDAADEPPPALSLREPRLLERWPVVIAGLILLILVIVLLVSRLR